RVLHSCPTRRSSDLDGNDYGPNESWIRSQEYSAVGWRNLIPSDKLLAEFEDGDPRLKFNFYFTGDTYGPPDNPVVLTDEAQRGNTSVYKGVEQKISWKKYSVMYKLRSEEHTSELQSR